MSTRKLKTYIRTVDALTLTVEPYWRPGYPRTWAASVHTVAGEDHGPISVACKLLAATTPAAARARAVNVGHRLLITAMIQGIGMER